MNVTRTETKVCAKMCFCRTPAQIQWATYLLIKL